MLLHVIVMDETIADADVLRTLITLSEAFGLPAFTVIGASLSGDDSKVASIMRNLRSADLTYRRLTEIQPFRSDNDSIAKLAEVLESIVICQDCVRHQRSQRWYQP